MGEFFRDKKGCRANRPGRCSPPAEGTPMKCDNRLFVRSTVAAVGASLRRSNGELGPRSPHSVAIRWGAVLGSLVLTGAAVGWLTAGADGPDATPTLAPRQQVAMYH